MIYHLLNIFVKYYSGWVVRRELMRCMHLYIGIERSKIVRIEVQKLFTITNSLVIRVSEVKHFKVFGLEILVKCF